MLQVRATASLANTPEAYAAVPRGSGIRMEKLLTQSQKKVTQKQKMARRLAWEIVIRIHELYSPWNHRGAGSRHIQSWHPCGAVRRRLVGTGSRALDPALAGRARRAFAPLVAGTRAERH